MSESGGLNVVNFDVECASLRLSNFLSLRDDFGTCKWHYFARYFPSNRLAILDDRFSFTSNTYPSADLPSSFYSKRLVSFRFLFSKHKALPDDLTCKSLYLLLLVLPSLTPKSAGFWGSVVGRPINRWAWVWVWCIGQSGCAMHLKSGVIFVTIGVLYVIMSRLLSTVF